MQGTFDRLWIAARAAFAREDGQTMTEYALILTLVAVACVGAFSLIATDIWNTIRTVVAALPG